jgi:hypothetical protein
MKMIFKFACAVFFFAFATLIVTMQFLDKQWFIDPSEDRKARIGGIIATLVACGAGYAYFKEGQALRHHRRENSDSGGSRSAVEAKMSRSSTEMTRHNASSAEVGVLLWFDSKKITAADFWQYGQYAYGVVLPLLAERIRPASQWTIFDGDVLSGTKASLPACRDEEKDCLREAAELGTHCYIIAIFGTDVADDLDKRLRAPSGPFGREGPAIGYLGKTTCVGLSRDAFTAVTQSLALIPALVIEGSTVKKLSFDYFEEDAMRSLGFTKIG